MKCCQSTPGSPDYILRVSHSNSVTPVSPLTHSRSLTIYLEALIELGGDALGGRDQVNWEMHLEAVIDRVWRCTGRPCSSEFGNSLGGRDRVN
jgi:hypothetical protein